MKQMTLSDTEHKLDARDALMVRDGSFNKITKIASRILDVPIAIISVTDVDRIWLVSQHGVADDHIARDPGLYASVVMTKEPLIISRSVTKDKDDAVNPLSITNNGLKFYAGVPLLLKDGTVAGALCVLDYEPRDLEHRQIDFLQDLAGVVADEIELRHAMRRVLNLESQLLKNAIEAKDKAEYVANHDSLTGLANRLYFTHLLEEEIGKSSSSDTLPAVYMLDLDKFKAANDTYGHQFGDAILKEVASRIQSCLGPNDVAARLGGDEFIILKRDTTPTQAAWLADCLVNKLALPYELEGHVAHLSSSIGLTLHTNKRDNSRQLVRNADLALYVAKSKGGRNYQVYTSSIDPMTQTRNR